MGGFMIAEVARLLKKDKVELAIRTLYCECCSRRSWIERSTNDRSENQARRSNRNGCLSRYKYSSDLVKLFKET